MVLIYNQFPYQKDVKFHFLHVPLKLNIFCSTNGCSIDNSTTVSIINYATVNLYLIIVC